jgi:hypothetical protein
VRRDRKSRSLALLGTTIVLIVVSPAVSAQDNR